ncbi:MAG: SDR family oxidoreductase [Candidatus Dojkabacteria bacterium]|nr:SDR family oxidoreductase [Candidatus Dojkabacteria bacterium]MDQ7021073.1 SDR family oxidoreductase [Candidatus Dojkabacteria bacterium]
MSNFSFIQADITNGEELEKRIKGNISNLKIDSILLTPAYNSHRLLKDTAYDEIKTAIDRKAIGFINLVKSVLNHLNSGASVVFIGSVHSLSTKDNSCVSYSAANGAVISSVINLAIEFKHLYRFNVISPGGFVTENYKNTYLDWKDKLRKKTAFPIDSIINTIEFLFSDMSYGISAQNIIVDGGRSVMRCSAADWELKV